MSYPSNANPMAVLKSTIYYRRLTFCDHTNMESIMPRARCAAGNERLSSVAPVLRHGVVAS